jgi:hypothetical protein
LERARDHELEEGTPELLLGL